MPTTEVAKRYFNALSAHDLDAALDCWKVGGVDRMVGQQELTAPDGTSAYFSELFAAFPDFRFEVIDTTTSRNRTAVRWRAEATFAGPGRFQGFAPNGARVAAEGCDVITVVDGKIRRLDAYLDSGAIARQLGFLPPAGSPGEARLAALANLRTRLISLIQASAPERIAEESDRLALVSDCFYMLDPQTGIKGEPRVLHPAFNLDTEQARDSMRKLAALSPSVAWAGHAEPVRGEARSELEAAAARP